MLARFFNRAEPSPFTLSLQPLGRDIQANSKASLLQAALDQGIAFPHNCRIGGCATCKCRLVSGKVRELTDKSYLLSAEEMSQNYILACQSVPKSDVVVEVQIDDSAPNHPVIHTGGVITRLEKLTHDIMLVEAQLEQPGLFTAGQYAEIYVPGVIKEGNRDTRCYSFASWPGEAPQVDRVTFYIRHVPGGAFTDYIFNEAKVGTRLEGHGPYGDFWLRPSSAPVLAIAGGSGMAPIKSLLEQARSEKITRDVVYFFGARTQQDLYGLDELKELANSWLARFEFVPVLSREPEDSDWQGRRGFVTQHLTEVLGDRLGEHHAYLCGPPPMVDGCAAELTRLGLDPAHIHSDKFLDRSHVVEA